MWPFFLFWWVIYRFGCDVFNPIKKKVSRQQATPYELVHPPLLCSFEGFKQLSCRSAVPAHSLPTFERTPLRSPAHTLDNS